MAEVFFAASPEYAGAPAAVERIFEACPCTQTLNEKSRVLIKPNLLAKNVPEAAVTTHPMVLRGVILALQKRGVKDITVADSNGGLYNTNAIKAIYKAAGLTAVCEEMGAKLFIDCTAAPKAANGVLVHSFNLLTPLHECDFIIDLPKMKTHVMTRVSCAVKNLFGCIPGLEKAELHMRFPAKKDFGNMLVDLCETVRPQLVVVDAVLSMEGNGPSGGTPRKTGVVIGGQDPYAIDLAVCRMMGIAPQEVPYLNAAIARGLCAQSAEAHTMAGDVQFAAPIPGWQKPDGQSDTDFANRAPAFVRPLVQWGARLVAPHPAIATKKCIGCGKCAEICPAKAITVENKKAHIDSKKCIRCFCCHEMCPMHIIEVKRFAAFKL